jgi:hypothetical protein
LATTNSPAPSRYRSPATKNSAIVHSDPRKANPASICRLRPLRSAIAPVSGSTNTWSTTDSDST